MSSAGDHTKASKKDNTKQASAGTNRPLCLLASPEFSVSLLGLELLPRPVSVRFAGAELETATWEDEEARPEEVSVLAAEEEAAEEEAEAEAEEVIEAEEAAEEETKESVLGLNVAVSK